MKTIEAVDIIHAAASRYITPQWHPARLGEWLATSMIAHICEKSKETVVPIPKRRGKKLDVIVLSFEGIGGKGILNNFPAISSSDENFCPTYNIATHQHEQSRTWRC